MFDLESLKAPIEHTRLVLANQQVREVEARVAASIFSVGLFARMLSPFVGAVALGQPGPVARTDNWWWRLVDGAVELAVDRHSDVVELTGAVEELCLPAARAIGSGWQVSDHLMTGNVASALAGAATVVGMQRPDLAERTRTAVEQVIEARLPGSGRFTPKFVRESCCLYYRASPGSYCGDCILAAH